MTNIDEERTRVKGLLGEALRKLDEAQIHLVIGPHVAQPAAGIVEGRAKDLLGEAVAKLQEAMESKIWSYTAEYELGHLAVAKHAIEVALESIDY